MLETNWEADLANAHEWEKEDEELKSKGIASAVRFALYMVFIVEHYQKTYPGFNYARFKQEVVAALVKKASPGEGA